MARRVLVVALSLAVVAVACAGSEENGERAAGRSATSTTRPARAGVNTVTTAAPSTNTSSGPPAGGPAEARVSPRAWVASEQGGELVEVNLDSLAVERRVPVDGSPHNLVVAGDGTVVATLQRAGTLALLAPGADAVRVVTLGGSPHDVKAAADFVVVANEGAAGLDLVGLDGAPRESIALPANPHDVALTPGGTAAWVSLDDSNDLVFVDLNTATVRRVSMPFRPHDLLVAPDGRVWVTKWGGGLARLSPEGAVEADLPVGEEVHHLAIALDGAQVWATDNAGRAVLVIDAASAQELTSFRLDGSPHHVALTGDRAAVADNTRGVVAVFDAAARVPLGDVPVGPGPHGVWAAP